MLHLALSLCPHHLIRTGNSDTKELAMLKSQFRLKYGLQKACSLLISPINHWVEGTGASHCVLHLFSAPCQAFFKPRTSVRSRTGSEDSFAQVTTCTWMARVTQLLSFPHSNRLISTTIAERHSKLLLSADFSLHS